MVADTATSLRRGVAVLSALHGEEALAAGGLGVLRIAELVGSDKSQVSRTLKILAEYGLVDRDPHTRAYRLGWQLFALASRAGDTHLLAAAGPVVKELGRTLGERSHLSVLQGTEVLTLLSEASPSTGSNALNRPRLSTTSPPRGTPPPTSPVFPPWGTTAMPSRVHNASTRATSSESTGRATSRAVPW